MPPKRQTEGFGVSHRRINSKVSWLNSLPCGNMCILTRKVGDVYGMFVWGPRSMPSFPLPAIVSIDSQSHPRSFRNVR
jgi:hypothetical protein